MTFVRSETELTTAATDALLGVVCLFLVWLLLDSPATAVWRRNLWSAVLGLMAIGSFLGAFAHGLEMRADLRALLWKPLYLALGLAVALVVVGAVYDWSGEAAARRLLPWALAVGVIFSIATQWLGGAFLVFIAYEGVATLLALAIYTILAGRGVLPGAGGIAAGILISLIAAVVQVTSLQVRMGVTLDHNALFHLIQIAGVIIMAGGLRMSLV